MNDLVAAIRAAIDETERVAQRAGAWHPTWTYDRQRFRVTGSNEPTWSIAALKSDGWPINDVDGEHIALHDPAAVLRRCAADRQMLALHAPYVAIKGDPICQTCLEGSHLYAERAYPCPTLHLLADGYGIEVPK